MQVGFTAVCANSRMIQRVSMNGLLYGGVACISFVLALGSLVATALTPRSALVERMAWSMGLGVGTIGLAGIVGHWVHMDFRVVTAIFALVALIAAIHQRRTTANRTLTTTHFPRWALVSSVIAGIASASAVVMTMGSLVLPTSHDAPIHVQVAKEIQAAHDVVVPLAEPAEHSSNVRPAVAFEAATAVVSEVARQQPADVVLPMIIIALIFFPLGISILTLEVTESRWLAAVVPWFTVGLLFPRVAVGFGEYPLVVDTLLIVPMLVTGVRWLRSGERRNIVMVGACVAVVMVTHGTELFTAVVFGIPLSAAVYWRRGHRPPWTRLVILIAMIGAVTGVMLQLLSLSASSVINTGTSGIHFSSVSASVGEALYLFGVMTLPGLVGAVLYVIGATTILLRRRSLFWLLALHLVLLAAFIDSVTGSRLFPLWLRLYPWSVPDRLLSLQYFVVPIIVALGLERVCWAVGRGSSSLSPHGQRWIVSGVVVVLCGTGIVHGFANDVDGYATAVTSANVVGSADRELIERIDQTLSPSSLILTDGLDDSGKWIPALTTLSIPMTKSWVDRHPNDWRIVALQNACTDPIGTRPALQDVQAVFIGSRRLPDAKHPWNTQCLDALPNLKRIDSESDGGGTAVLYQVQH